MTDNLRKHYTKASFMNKKEVAEGLSEAILDGDSEALQDILYGFLSNQNKKKLSKRTNLSHSTIYNAGKGSLSLKTLVKVIHHST